MITMDSKTGLYQKAMGGTELQFNGLMDRLPQEYKDKFQFICSRVREIDPNKKPILWLHDTWDDQENNHLKNPRSLERFAKLVFVSNYQFQTYHLAHGIKYQDSMVLKNCIEPIEGPFNKPDPNERINLIYHTTPHRGLEILVPVFEHLAQRHPNIYLDVYSSFNIYGWGHRDEPYQQIIDRCKNHPRINYHGSVPNHEVREALKKAHLFAFPSIWPETSCIAAIEAMSAEVGIVCPDFAALPETTMGNALMYRFQEVPQDHANIFVHVLEDAILKVKSGELKNHFSYARNVANMHYSWAARLPQWTDMLDSI